MDENHSQLILHSAKHSLRVRMESVRTEDGALGALQSPRGRPDEIAMAVGCTAEVYEVEYMNEPRCPLNHRFAMVDLIKGMGFWRREEGVNI